MNNEAKLRAYADELEAEIIRLRKILEEIGGPGPGLDVGLTQKEKTSYWAARCVWIQSVARGALK